MARTLLRLAAIWMCVAGAATVIVALLFTVTTGARTALSVGLAFLAGGGAGFVLATSRRALLPGERIASSASTRTMDGWQALLALAFIAVPVWAASQLGPLTSGWRDFAMVLDEAGGWGDTSGFGGLFLLPVIIAVLGVPLIVTASAATFILGSTMLFVLTMMRSAWLPRTFLIFTLMQGAMVLASVSGVATIERTIPVVEQAIGDASATSTASGISRSERGSLMMRASCRTLVWALAGYLPFVLLLLSSRRPTVYAGVPSFAAPWPRRPPPEPVDHRTATGDDLEQYFKDAARFVDSKRSGQKDRQ